MTGYKDLITRTRKIAYFYGGVDLAPLLIELADTLEEAEGATQIPA